MMMFCQEGGEEAGDAAEEGEEEVQAGAQGQEEARPLQAGPQSPTGLVCTIVSNKIKAVLDSTRVPSKSTAMY